MRVTYIHQHYKSPREAGGGRPFEFASRLARSGHKVTMICAGSGNKEIQEGGFTVRQINVAYDNQMTTLARIWSFLKFMWRASVAAASVPSDIVFASSTPLTVVVPGFVASRLRRAKLVVEVRDLWPEAPIELGVLPRSLHGPARFLEKFGYRVAHHVIALSPGMGDGVHQVFNRVPVTIIPNASDAIPDIRQRRSTARAQFGISDDDEVFVYAGSLGKIYDPLWLADAAVSLHSLGHRMIIAGDGALRDVAMRKVADAGLDPHQIFIGPIARESVIDLLSCADVAVSSVIPHPTLRHASINKIFDALGAGLPIVMNHSGWLSSLVCEASAGMRVQHPEEIALACDPGWRAIARIQAAELAKDFDREKLYIEFERVLREVSYENH